MLKCSFVCIFVCLCLSILVVLSMNSRWHFVTYGDIGWHLYVKDEYGNKGALFERGGVHEMRLANVIVINQIIPLLNIRSVYVFECTRKIMRLEILESKSYLNQISWSFEGGCFDEFIGPLLRSNCKPD